MRWLMLAPLLLISSAGCDKAQALFEKEPPAQLSYGLLFMTKTKHGLTTARSLVEGLDLFIDGERAGTLQGGAVDSHRGVPAVVVDWDTKAFLSDKKAELTLAYPTPCGTIEAPIPSYSLLDILDKSFDRAAEERSRKHADKDDPLLVVVVLPDELEQPESFVVWVDHHELPPAAKIEVGEAEIRERVDASHRVDGKVVSNGRRRELWGLDCAKEHDVKVDGKKIGTIDPKAKANSAYLVSTEPGTCYRAKETRYDSAVTFGPSGKGFYVGEDPVVNAIGWREIDYFLEPAPGAVEGSGPSSRRSLVRTECKADEPKK